MCQLAGSEASLTWTVSNSPCVCRNARDANRPKRIHEIIIARAIQNEEKSLRNASTRQSRKHIVREISRKILINFPRYVTKKQWRSQRENW